MRVGSTLLINSNPHVFVDTGITIWNGVEEFACWKLNFFKHLIDKTNKL